MKKNCNNYEKILTELLVIALISFLIIPSIIWLIFNNLILLFLFFVLVIIILPIIFGIYNIKKRKFSLFTSIGYTTIFYILIFQSFYNAILKKVNEWDQKLIQKWVIAEIEKIKLKKELKILKNKCQKLSTWNNLNFTWNNKK